MSGLFAGTASGFLVGVSALVYSPKLANGELPERYAFSRPLSDLAPGLNDDLSAIAAANGNVDLPVRISSKTAADGQSEVFVALADGITVPSNVRVVAATFNAQLNVYSVTTEDVPPRTLTWTPIVDPGNSSTTSPAEQPVPTVYTGATVTPVRVSGWGLRRRVRVLRCRHRLLIGFGEGSSRISRRFERRFG